MLQTLLAGLAAAQAATAFAADPAVVICHAFPAADQDGTSGDPGIPDANKDWHLCCVACTASTVTTPPPSAFEPFVPMRAAGSVAEPRCSISFVRETIRAGLIRAPPISL